MKDARAGKWLEGLKKYRLAALAAPARACRLQLTAQPCLLVPQTCRPLKILRLESGRTRLSRRCAAPSGGGAWG